MKNLFIFSIALFFTTSLYGQSGSSAKVKASLERGKTVYEQHCLACHQADGSGVQNLNPPLAKTKWVLGEKKTLIQIVLKGMDEEIDVDGDVYHNIMPPLAYLGDQEIADVLSYVRNSFGNKASPVTTEEVKAMRAKLK